MVGVGGRRRMAGTDDGGTDDGVTDDGGGQVARGAAK